MEHGNTKKKIERNEKQKEKAEREREPRECGWGKKREVTGRKTFYIFIVTFLKLCCLSCFLFGKQPRKIIFNSVLFLNFSK